MSSATKSISSDGLTVKAVAVLAQTSQYKPHHEVFHELTLAHRG
jgi:hypothetical protein